MPQSKSDIAVKIQAHIDKKTATSGFGWKYVRPETQVRKYQILGALLLWYQDNFLLADGCGLGKTLQTLLAYAIEKEECEKKGKTPPKLLVVTEKSALLQWPEEMDKFCTGLTSVHVPAGKKAKGFEKPHDYRESIYNSFTEDMLVVAHRTFTLDWRKGLLLDVVRGNLLILDEADLIRSSDSQIYKAFKSASKIAKGFKALTATPIYTGLKDYYNLMKVVRPRLFGDWESFLREYCEVKIIQVKTRKNRKVKVKVIEDYKNVEQFHDLASDYLLHRTPDEVGKELPEIIEKPVYLEMSPAQAKVYKRAAEKAYNVMPGAEVPRKKKDGKLEDAEDVQERLERTAESALVTQVRKLQATGHPRILGEKAPSVKTEKLLQLVQGDLYKQKVVVFSQFVECVDILEEALTEQDITTCRITGKESTSQERNDSMVAFRKPGPPYVMLVTTAAKKAVNLQVAGNFIFYDQPLAWGDSVQLIGRIRRLGSEWKHALVIRLMVRDTADEWVYKILSQEDELVERCLRKGGTMQVTEALLTYVIDKVKQGKKVTEALEEYSG